MALFGGACSISYPIGSMVPVGDDVTGSIRPRAGSPAGNEDLEDRRRAKAALATALDPQGAGTPVSWDNPGSGNKGIFKPLGRAYAADTRICRAFEETAAVKGSEPVTRHSKACTTPGTGDWTVVDRKDLGKDLSKT